MPRDGRVTRERILDRAQELILDRGYAGMSVDRLIEAAGVTKGAFFYHFRTKDDLARALIERFAAKDAQIYHDVRARAERLASDPLEQMLVFVGLFEEMFEGLTDPYPGCLFASYVYELQQFDAGTLDVIRTTFRMWRELLAERFSAIAEKYPPKVPVDPSSLADAFTVVLEGAFVAGKALEEPKLIAEQLRHFRNYIELLFRSAGARPVTAAGTGS